MAAASSLTSRGHQHRSYDDEDDDVDCNDDNSNNNHNIALLQFLRASAPVHLDVRNEMQ